MGKAQAPYANRGPIEATSISTALAFSPPMPWIHVVSAGSGSIVIVSEDGNSHTLTGLVAGDVLLGPFAGITSMTLSKIRYGDGPPPASTAGVAVPSLTGSLSAIVRMGAAGAQTNTGTTMANLADLTVNVTAGQKVSGTMRIFANNSTGAEGIKFDLGGGTATFTSIEFGFTAAPSGATVGTRSSTAYQTAVTCSAVATSDACFHIAYAGVVNAAGTIIPRFAENSTSSGTATVQINSVLTLETTAN